MADYEFLKEIIPTIEKDLIKNLAGGYAFKANNFTVLDRWLLTGSSSNLFYQDKSDLTEENIKCLIECAKQDAKRTADRIVYASFHGVSLSTPILALAILSTLDGNCKEEFKRIYKEVIRTASQLYQYLEFNKTLRGFGKIVRKSVTNWFEEREDLEYQLLKYQSRNNWSHRDVLRKFHIIPNSPEKSALYKWIAKGWSELDEKEKNLLNKISWFERIKGSSNEEDIVKAIKEGNLTWEMVIGNTQIMTTSIWKELFLRMPMTATIRYLATLTANDVFKDLSMLDLLEKRLTDEENLKRASIHPLSLAKALFIYRSGGKESERSKLRYSPISRVIDILDASIEKSFSTIPSTGKNILVSVDVSSSMWSGSIYGNLVPAQIAGVLALSIVKSEKNYKICMFDTEYRNMDVTKNTSFSSMVNRKSGIWPSRFGGTDASLAYQHALKNKVSYDAFINITDNETWGGPWKTPALALEKYRNTINPKAKAIYISTSIYGDRITLADPKDILSYDISGFSDETPKIIQLILNDAI